MQCHKLKKPQFLNWGFLIILFITSCTQEKNISPDPSQIDQPNTTETSITELKKIANDQAIIDGYILSWERKNSKPSIPNPLVVSIYNSCDYSQSSNEQLVCFIQSTLQQYPIQTSKYQLCLSLSSKLPDLKHESHICKALYHPKPSFEHPILNLKANNFLEDHNPMNLASFKWNSLEWVYFLNFVKNKLTGEDIQILDNYFRFSTAENTFIRNAFDEITND
jgi:hypothetical protein